MPPQAIRRGCRRLRVRASRRTYKQARVPRPCGQVCLPRLSPGQRLCIMSTARRFIRDLFRSPQCTIDTALPPAVPSTLVPISPHSLPSPISRLDTPAYQAQSSNMIVFPLSTALWRPYRARTFPTKTRCSIPSTTTPRIVVSRRTLPIPH